MSLKKEDARTRVGAEPTRADSALKDTLYGLILGAASLAASFLAGLKLLEKLYYVEWLAASIMGFHLLVAWLLYLRDDAFMKKRGGAESIGSAPAEGGNAPFSSKRARRILLTAAAFLALSSLVLYYGFGVGDAI
jgi:hypothetical protein